MSPVLGQKITCPFCFESFTTQEIQFRCLNPNCKGRALDTMYAVARDMATPLQMGHVINGKRSSFAIGVARSTDCDVCGKEARTRLCPKCHFELSHDVGQIDQKIIAIIGGSNTGKSHYIASLITHLQHVIGPNFDFSVSMLGDNTRMRWNRDFYTPLFEKKMVLQPTQSSTLNSDVKTPLMFRLTFRDGSHLRALNISFFDTAGEDMSSLRVDSLSVEARYICKADGLIVLLDPLQIDSIRQQLSDSIQKPKPDPMARPEFIIGRLRELFEGYHHLSGSKKIPIPIAFTFSKVDTLRDLVAPDSAILQHSMHYKALDLQDVQSVSTEIGNYVQAWINTGFYNEIDYKFANYRFFGVSSLGNQPEASGKVKLEPLRVEDPFLWILYELKLIKGKKGR
jgi:hypothetical protein